MQADDERSLTIKGDGMAKGQKVVIKEIPMNKIKLGRNSRMHQRDEDLSDLMQSINSTGLLEPIGVIEHANGGFEVSYGNRRFMAFSRLGLHSIPAVIHKAVDAKKIDVMNLAENIQRKNVSPHEIGRYIKLLEGEGLKKNELCVRLGVSSNFIDSCVSAYEEVPKEFRNDLEASTLGQRVTPGKIALSTARAVISAAKTHRLGTEFVKPLLRAAKTDKRFNTKSLPEYIAAMKRNSKDPIGSARQVKTLNFNFMIDQSSYDSLVKKHIEEGPFNSFTALLKAVLQGKKAVRIPVID